VTYNEGGRVQFFADLANPAVPLHRMAREGKAPRDFKGLELLDTMFARVAPTRPGVAAVSTTSEPIPFDRALWFIRVLGSHEIAAHRQRVQAAGPAAAPSPMPNTPSSSAAGAGASPAAALSSNDWYTQEFTNLFTSWLRTQLGQLVLPAKGSAQPPKAATGVLGDEKTRGRWLAKWSYRSVLASW
jgi:mediator of RNA polymerase II transcription subunit 12